MAVLSIGQMWASVLPTEDFENQTAGSTYNSQISYDADDSNAGMAWYVEHGTVSTNSKLNGEQSMQMRGYYAKSSTASAWNGDLPYLESKTAVTGLQSISLKIAAAATFKIDFMYREDGSSTWTAMKTDEETPSDATNLSFTTSASTVTYNIPSSDPTKAYFVKIVANSSSTHTANPTKAGNIVIRVDDVVFTYEEGESTKPTLSMTPTTDANFVGSQEITLSTTTDGASIYYTLDETTPSSASTLYSSAFTITETKTVKAIAIKGSDESDVITRTFTKIEPLTTMDAIFTAATTAGSTATDVYITFNNWVVTGVKNSNAYVTDGTKGFIIYASGHGFVVGNVLSGTAACKVQLYNGSAELTNLTSSTTGLSVATGGTAPVNVLDAEGIAALTGAHTGSLIKISGECTYESSKYYIAGVQLYNQLYSFSVSAGTNYDCTGVYCYHTTYGKEIMPRSAGDIVVSSSVSVTGVDLTESSASVEVGETVTLHASVVPGTATDKDIVWSVTSGSDKASVANGVVTGLAAGEAVIRAASHEDESIYDECTVTVTAADPTKHVVTFDATVDKTTEATDLSITKSNLTIAITEGDGRFNNGTDYRPYKNAVFTVSCSAGNITKIEFTCTTSKPITGFADLEGLDKANEVWTGNAASVSFTASGAQVQMTQLVITYKEDARPEAGLAWDPSDDIELTVGDAFTAPTLLNPNSIDAAEITIESSNPSVATVTAGVVALVADATGTTTITATFAGNDDYKPATVSYTITVNAAAPAPLTDYYQKVTETAGIVEGTYLIVYEDGENSLAFNGALGYDSDHKIDIEDNTIDVAIVDGDKIAVSSATEASTFYIDPTAGSIQAACGKFIGVGSYSNGLSVSDNADAYVNALSIDDDDNAVIVITTTGGDMTLRYNAASNQARFRYYKSGQQPIALYKLANEVIKPEAGLAWDPATDIEITVGDALPGRTLLNPNSIDAAEITIASSNTDVATVDAGVVSLVADATGTTTITATFAGNASYKPATVSYKIKVNPASSIYVSPSLNVNFSSVEKDAALPTDQKITVTLNNVAAATATLGGTNPDAFSVDKTALTESGDITISVVSSATVGEFKATLTISDDASVAASKEVKLSFTVTDPASEETPISTSTEWVAATEIADGMQVLITGVKDEVVYAMGEQKSTNRAAYVATLNEGVLTPGEGTMAFTLVAQGDGTYAIRTSNGKYLYAAASGSNHLKTQDEVDVNAKWTLTVASAVAEGSSNRNVMQFNGSGTNKLFACYATANQSAIQFYVPKPAPAPKYSVTYAANGGSGDAPAAVEYEEGETFSVAAADLFTAPEGKEFDKWNDGTNDYAPGETYTVGTSNVVLTAYWKDAPVPPTSEDVRTGLELNRYYTICLGKDVTAATGATFWNLEHRNSAETEVYLEEVNLPLEAGKPYIFQATATTLNVTYGDETQATPVENGALRGTFDDLNATELAAKATHVYILIQNSIRPAGGENSLKANRAYIDYDELVEISEAPQGAPGKRVRAIPMQPKVATGMDALNASDKPVKMVINGQLFILRGEKLYDATGCLVK